MSKRKLKNNKDKEILKAARITKYPHAEEGQILTVEFSVPKIEAKRQSNNIFKVLSDNNCQSRMSAQ